MKITPAQLTVLKELSAPGVRAHFMYGSGPSLETYYFLSCNMKRCTAQIRALINAGLAERFNDDGFSRHQVRITTAGRRCLAEAAKERTKQKKKAVLQAAKERT